MFDFVTTTWNPIYGKCSHDCGYCLDGETLILMSNLSHKKIKDIKVGDKVMGVKRGGRYNHLEEAKVEGKMRRESAAISITTEHTSVICSPWHKWLTERNKWKSEEKGLKRGDGIKLLNENLCKESSYQKPEREDDNYKKGYLRGMILGDGTLKKYNVKKQRIVRNGKKYIYPPTIAYKFRLALKDDEALKRTKAYLDYFGQPTFDHIHSGLDSIRKDGKQSYNRIKELMEPMKNDRFLAGFLGGFFDAEGSFSNNGALRISNKIIDELIDALGYFKFKYHKHKRESNGVYDITINGGFNEHVRFFNITDPAITRKRKRFLKAIKYGYSKILLIKSTGFQRLYDIQTSTGNYIANGLISHNCYMKRFPQKELNFKAEEVNEINLGKGKTIFVGSATDMFAEDVPLVWIEDILKKCLNYPDNVYLFQTKNPERFFNHGFEFPPQVIYGTTIESNRNYKNCYATIPYDRAMTMSWIGGRKTVTIEPIMDFDLGPLLSFIERASPEFVSIGADSKGHNLPEPSYEKVVDLIAGLEKFTEVKKKSNLERLLKY